MKIGNISKAVIFAACACLFVYGIAQAAPKGDGPATALNGRLAVQPYDAGVGGRTAVPSFTGQNALALYHNGNLDAGTAVTIYCGWETNNTTVQNYPLVGFPLPVGATLSIDITTLSKQADGGVIGSAPQLFCAAASGTMGQMEIRYMVVK